MIQKKRFHGQSSKSNNLLRFCLPAMVFLWPMAYYFRALIPGHHFSLRIINDFLPLYYYYKLYLIDFLSAGAIPLWSPSEACGFSFYSSPFAQFFYPLNLLLILFYKVFGGYSIFDHQAYTVLGVSIYSLGLYLWLKLLCSNHRAVIFSTLLISMNFKLGEILRFPNAVHTACWMPWILYGITLAMGKEKNLRAAMVVFASCFMYLTGGYPYYVYYGIFLFFPYVLIMLSKPLYTAMEINDRVCPSFRTKGFGILSASSLAALALCSPYLYKMYKLLTQTSGRMGSSYTHSTSHVFDGIDILGSIIFPPSANHEGWYYFSMVGFFLLVVFFAGALINFRGSKTKRYFILLSLIWMVLISSVTYGKNSYLFDFLWNYLPGFSNLRVWGRLNIVMLPILSIFLARGYHFFETLLSTDYTENPVDRRKFVFVFTAFAIFSIGSILIQTWLQQGKLFDEYWYLYFKKVNGKEWLFIVYGITSAALIGGFLLISLKHPFLSKFSKLMVFLTLFGVAMMDLYPVGSNQWMQKAPEGYGVARKRVLLDQMMQNSFHIPRVREYQTISLPNFNVGWIGKWYFDRYMQFDRNIFSVDHSKEKFRYKLSDLKDPELLPYYSAFMGLENGKRVFATKRINHSSIREYLYDAQQTESHPQYGISINRYDGDMLHLSVDVSEGVNVSFIDNWDPDWKAWINGKPTEIEKLFGTFKSVRVDPGRNDILFKYSPFFLGKP